MPHLGERSSRRGGKMLLVTNIGSVRSVLAPTRRCAHMVDGAGARRSIAGAALVSGGAELVGGLHDHISSLTSKVLSLFFLTFIYF